MQLRGRGRIFEGKTVVQETAWKWHRSTLLFELIQKIMLSFTEVMTFLGEIYRIRVKRPQNHRSSPVSWKILQEVSVFSCMFRNQIYSPWKKLSSHIKIMLIGHHFNTSEKWLSLIGRVHKYYITIDYLNQLEYRANRWYKVKSSRKSFCHRHNQISREADFVS